MYGHRDAIIPFWTNSYLYGNGLVFFNQYTNGTVLQRATQDINEYFPELNFTASWVFVTTWYKLAYSVSHLALNGVIHVM